LRNRTERLIAEVSA